MRTELCTSGAWEWADLLWGKRENCVKAGRQILFRINRPHLEATHPELGRGGLLLTLERSCWVQVQQSRLLMKGCNESGVEAAVSKADMATSCHPLPAVYFLLSTSCHPLPVVHLLPSTMSEGSLRSMQQTGPAQKLLLSQVRGLLRPEAWCSPGPKEGKGAILLITGAAREDARSLDDEARRRQGKGEKPKEGDNLE